MTTSDDLSTRRVHMSLLVEESKEKVVVVVVLVVVKKVYER